MQVADAGCRESGRPHITWPKIEAVKLRVPSSHRQSSQRAALRRTLHSAFTAALHFTAYPLPPRWRTAPRPLGMPRANGADADQWSCGPESERIYSAEDGEVHCRLTVPVNGGHARPPF
uniref:Uncharacterized protein n=1 Tax=Eutreptiella gymnastica TaxID=73025 RepID=A0A7S4GFB6_9EUGL